ncbi:hypothetical protein K438DRAFT_1938755 [Mycena galopus ATCC 62051]|nr:hypothetical protein K438DRAFT_1938755 [Mycena galopus ATCC 62051]
MTSPPAKRQRTENASITRSDVWYKDGSVVLQAENTQFRVHWSILSQHSSFFLDLQDLPQPPDEPTVDGCPVVELQDTVEDVQFLLKALYDPFFVGQTALPFAAMAAFIRLGRKYDFKTLFDSAVARLTFEIPATLEEHDARLVDDKYQLTTIIHYREFYFDLLMLARENRILSVLPLAYYHVLSCSTAEIFDNLRKRDETLTCLRQCLISREKILLKQFQPGYTMGWLRKWDYKCGNSAKCGAIRESWFRLYMDDNTVMPFHSFVPDELRAVFCATCSQHILESTTAGRKKMWEELPGIVELAGWAELKNNL